MTVTPGVLSAAAPNGGHRPVRCRRSRGLVASALAALMAVYGGGAVPVEAAAARPPAPYVGTPLVVPAMAETTCAQPQPQAKASTRANDVRHGIARNVPLGGLWPTEARLLRAGDERLRKRSVAGTPRPLLGTYY
jgi:hypothetical protein